MIILRRSEQNKTRNTGRIQLAVSDGRAAGKGTYYLGMVGRGQHNKSWEEFPGPKIFS